MQDPKEKLQLPFAEPWLDMADASQELKNGLLTELKKEVHRKHPLYRLKAEVIGQRQDNDDVLIKLEDGRIAVVHLTWAGKREHGPWPITDIYEDRKDFIENRLLPDIEN